MCADVFGYRDCRGGRCSEGLRWCSGVVGWVDRSRICQIVVSGCSGCCLGLFGLLSRAVRAKLSKSPYLTAPFDSLTSERTTFYLIFTLFCIDNLVFLIICIIFPAIFFLKFLCLLNISLITIRNLRNHYSKPSFSIVLLNVDSQV